MLYIDARLRRLMSIVIDELNLNEKSIINFTGPPSVPINYKLSKVCTLKIDLDAEIALISSDRFIAKLTTNVSCCRITKIRCNNFSEATIKNDERPKIVRTFCRKVNCLRRRLIESKMTQFYWDRRWRTCDACCQWYAAFSDIVDRK